MRRSPDETVRLSRAADATVSGAPSGESSPPVTPPRKSKPFGKKPKPADENESVGVSNSSAAVSGDSVGTPKPPKNRFTRTQEAPR